MRLLVFSPKAMEFETLKCKDEVVDKSKDIDVFVVSPVPVTIVRSILVASDSVHVTLTSETSTVWFK